jgi:hypothetical protein
MSDGCKKRIKWRKTENVRRIKMKGKADYDTGSIYRLQRTKFLLSRKKAQRVSRCLGHHDHARLFWRF